MGSDNLRARLDALERRIPRGLVRTRPRLDVPPFPTGEPPEWVWLPEVPPGTPRLEIPSYDERFEHPDGSPRDDIPSEVPPPEPSPYY